jgi:hypothetical protein
MTLSTNTQLLATFSRADKMRTVRFHPYRKGCGPTFTLNLFYLGHDRIGYELRMRENGISSLLFSGSDFRPSPMHSVDGDDAVKSLMGFLTLRPGDTDADYFADYTEEQMAFCQQHGEYLSFEVLQRFGE